MVCSLLPYELLPAIVSHLQLSDILHLSACDRRSRELVLSFLESSPILRQTILPDQLFRPHLYDRFLECPGVQRITHLTILSTDGISLKALVPSSVVSLKAYFCGSIADLRHCSELKELLLKGSYQESTRTQVYLPEETNLESLTILDMNYDITVHDLSRLRTLAVDSWLYFEELAIAAPNIEHCSVQGPTWRSIAISRAYTAGALRSLRSMVAMKGSFTYIGASFAEDIQYLLQMLPNLDIYPYGYGSEEPIEDSRHQLLADFHASVDAWTLANKAEQSDYKFVHLQKAERYHELIQLHTVALGTIFAHWNCSPAIEEAIKGILERPDIYISNGCHFKAPSKIPLPLLDRLLHERNRRGIPRIDNFEGRVELSGYFSSQERCDEIDFDRLALYAKHGFYSKILKYVQAIARALCDVKSWAERERINKQTGWKQKKYQVALNLLDLIPDYDHTAYSFCDHLFMECLDAAATEGAFLVVKKLLRTGLSINSNTIHLIITRYHMLRDNESAKTLLLQSLETILKSHQGQISLNCSDYKLRPPKWGDRTAAGMRAKTQLHKAVLWDDPLLFEMLLKYGQYDPKSFLPEPSEISNRRRVYFSIMELIARLGRLRCLDVLEEALGGPVRVAAHSTVMLLSFSIRHDDMEVIRRMLPWCAMGLAPFRRILLNGIIQSHAYRKNCQELHSYLSNMPTDTWEDSCEENLVATLKAKFGLP